MACCKWAAPAGRRYQLSLEELVAIFSGSSALTAALEPLKVISKRQRGQKNLKICSYLARKLGSFGSLSPQAFKHGKQIEFWHVDSTCAKPLNPEERQHTHIALSKTQLRLRTTVNFHGSFSLSVPHLFTGPQNHRGWERTLISSSAIINPALPSAPLNHIHTYFKSLPGQRFQRNIQPVPMPSPSGEKAFPNIHSELSTA